MRILAVTLSLIVPAIASAGSKAGVCALHLQVARSVLFDPLPYAQSVAAKGLQHITIDQIRIAELAQDIAHSDYQLRMASWDMPPYPDSSASFDKMFEYFLVLNSINYMYLDAATGATFGNDSTRDGLRGAARTAEVLTQNWDKISQPGVLANLKLPEAAQLFRSEHALPDLPSRVRHLNAVGQFLDKNRGVNWGVWLEQFPRALDLAKFIAKTIPGFDDPFIKRAQLFTGMLVGRFYAAEELPQNLRNLEGMSVYADYILPAVLRRLGVLHYARDLAREVDQGAQLRSGSRLEIEIRAATLIAADQLHLALNQTPRFRDNPITILALDAALWLQGGEIEFPGSRLPEEFFRGPVLPHHLTLTSDY